MPGPARFAQFLALDVITQLYRGCQIEPVAWIHRHTDNIGDRSSQEEIRRFGAIIFQHPYPIAGFRAKRQQFIGKPYSKLPRLFKCQTVFPATITLGLADTPIKSVFPDCYAYKSYLTASI